MPLREFACSCGTYLEIYHTAINPADVPVPKCAACTNSMSMLWSIPHVDTSDNFHPFDYTGPDGRQWRIDNLHKLRKVEHAYLETGHNIRFDAYSAEPNNPDAIDGFGLEHWDGTQNATGKTIVSLPTMEN